jgi:TetR/AcrR family transcriptional regulator
MVAGACHAHEIEDIMSEKRKTAEASAEQPTRRRLIKAATAAFAQSGYEGARINDIAARAKANKQLVYHYFGSKEGLYRVVLEELYLKYRGNEAALDAVMREPDPEAAIWKLVRHLFMPSASLREFQRLLQDLNLQKHRRFLMNMEGVQSSYVRLIECVDTILKRGAAAGVFRQDVDAKEFYVNLTGVCAVRIYNAASLSFMLGMDLESQAGARTSQEAGVALVIDSIRPRG